MELEELRHAQIAPVPSVRGELLQSPGIHVQRVKGREPARLDEEQIQPLPELREAAAQQQLARNPGLDLDELGPGREKTEEAEPQVLQEQVVRQRIEVALLKT